MFNCTGSQPGTIGGDIDRAITYTDATIAALTKSPLERSTELDWYFNSQATDTADKVRIRLGCIRECLRDTKDNNRWGCDPGYGASANAYVAVGSTPVCTDALVPVCFTGEHFGNTPRKRGGSHPILIPGSGRRTSPSKPSALSKIVVRVIDL